jgi:hypothetical protein
MTINFPQSLVQETAERRVVFFVGSGISKTAQSSLPTWPQLLESLSEQLQTKIEKNLVKKMVQKGRMLDAAQIITQGINRPDLNACIRQTFQIRPIPNNEIYRSILDLDSKTIVTTNYDELLEKNFEHFSNGQEAFTVRNYRSETLLNDLRSPIRTIVKLHGCVSDPAKLVLDRSSYFRAQACNPGLFRILQALMTINTVVFLGYSVSDPDIQLILENINMFSPSEHPHYAIMAKPEHRSITDSLQETYNVRVLAYRAGEHAVVPDALESFRNEVVELRQRRGIA